MKETLISNKKILIYIPMRNSAARLKNTIESIPKSLNCEFIAVDNGSKDNSVELASTFGLKVIKHYFDRGYGASQKTAYNYALGKDVDIVVMLHSDGQYDPLFLPQIIEPLLKDEADAVFGSRILGKGALKGGMPRWKYSFNIFLTWLENKILDYRLSEFHTGYRAYNKRLLERIPFFFNSDSWLFDSEIIFQIKNLGFRIKEIPITTSYHKGSSSVNFLEGTGYGLGVFYLCLKYFLHCKGILRQKQFI